MEAFVGNMRSQRHRRYYETFIARKFVHTKFFDRPTLQRLGLEDCTLQLLSHGGLGKFLDLSAPSSQELTLEFLATLERHDDGITFNLLGQQRMMSYQGLRDLFGVTEAPTEDWEAVGTLPELFWQDATREVLNPSAGEYNYKLTHPCLRLVHKVLSMSFLGHGEVNKVPTLDLTVLWCLTSESHNTPDWVDLFLRSCLGLREKTSGKISMGGMVTLISQQYENIMDHWNFPADIYTYNITLMRRSHLLEVRDGEYIWLSKKERTHRMRLPRPMSSGARARDFYLYADGEQASSSDDEEGDDDDKEEDETAAVDMESDVPSPLCSRGPPVYPDYTYQASWSGSGSGGAPWDQLLDRMDNLQLRQAEQSRRSAEWERDISQRLEEQARRSVQWERQVSTRLDEQERRSAEWQRNMEVNLAYHANRLDSHLTTVEDQVVHMQRRAEAFFNAYGYWPPPQ